MFQSRFMATMTGVLALAAFLGACSPADPHADDRQNAHFQKGLKLVSSLDSKGAVEEFEKALEDNPHSAAAHFELGCLYDKLGDGAAAIYHYQQHLKWKPNSDQAQLLNERIHGCKQDLANNEFSPPSTQNLQRQVDRLTAENLALKEQLTAWQHYAAASGRATPARDTAPVKPTAEPAKLAATSNFQATAAPPANARPKVHVVKQRETISSIAVEYGVKASAVLAVNPRVDPRRLRIGQSLALP